MRILIDVDGVVADFLVHLWKYLDTDVKISELKSWHLLSDLPKYESDQIKEIFTDMEFWKTLPVKPGAKEAIQSLRDAGHDILWVTSPYPPCYGWASERMAWLARNFDVHPHDVCITHRKGCVTGDIFIDDKPENIAEWQEMNPRGRAFIYAHAFNASETFPRITWDTMWNSINQK